MVECFIWLTVLHMVDCLIWLTVLYELYKGVDLFGLAAEEPRVRVVVLLDRLSQKQHPPALGPPYGPRHSPTAGS